MKKTIIIFGSKGSFAHETALANFPDENYVHIQSIETIFEKIENCGTDKIFYGMIPLCNSQSGFVRATFEYFLKNNFNVDSLYRFNPQQLPEGKNLQFLQKFIQENPVISQIIFCPIEQNLLALPGKNQEQITTIASHAQALWQCSDYLAENFPDAAQIEWADTATAARDLANGILKPYTAVIASTHAAKLYHLNIFQKNIQNKNLHGRNVTTFLLLKPVRKISYVQKKSDGQIKKKLSSFKKNLTFGIIGHGRFGKLWAECLRPFGKVLIHDKAQKNSTPLEKVVQVDFLFLLVPINQMENCCRSIAPLLNQRTVVVDACSVKEYPARMMLKNLLPQQPIIATHPLFGPDSVRRLGLAGRKIVVHPLRCHPSSVKIFGKILRQLQLEIIHTTPRDHDQKMAQSQALVHFLGRAFSSLHLEDQNISTPDYQSLVRINDMVQNDTKELFYGMQNYNRFAASMRKKLMEALVQTDADIRKHSGVSNLRQLRRQIDDLDRQIIHLLAIRLNIAQKIGQHKKTNKMGIFDRQREKKLRYMHETRAKKQKLNLDFIKNIFNLIVQESKKIQKDRQKP